MNGLLLPVKGLTCTSASPQGDPQLHVHIREPTRGSPDSRAHAQDHKEIHRLARTCASPQGDPQPHVHIREPTYTSANPHAHPRAHARIPGQARRTAVRVAPLLTSLTSTTTPPRTDTPARAHSPVSAERSHGLVNWRGEKRTRNGTAAGHCEENTKKPDQKIRLKWWAILGSNQ